MYHVGRLRKVLHKLEKIDVSILATRKYFFAMNKVDSLWPLRCIEPHLSTNICYTKVTYVYWYQKIIRCIKEKMFFIWRTQKRKYYTSNNRETKDPMQSFSNKWEMKSGQASKVHINSWRLIPLLARVSAQ